MNNTQNSEATMTWSKPCECWQSSLQLLCSV